MKFDKIHLWNTEKTTNVCVRGWWANLCYQEGGTGSCFFVSRKGQCWPERCKHVRNNEVQAVTLQSKGKDCQFNSL